MEKQMQDKIKDTCQALVDNVSSHERHARKNKIHHTALKNLIQYEHDEFFKSVSIVVGYDAFQGN